MKKFWQKFDKNYLLILVLAIFLIYPLLSINYFYGHDTPYHVIHTIALSMKRGFSLLNPKIFAILGHNFGYGSGIFYPQLSHIVSALFALSLSPFTSTVTYGIKLMYFTAFFLSGVTMYLLVKEVSKNKTSALGASIFYMTSAYHIEEMVIRDAQGEMFIFVFLPLILLGIHYLFNNKIKYFYVCFVLGYVGLINSHLVMAVYFTLFVGLILLAQYKKVFKKEVISRFIIASGLIILLSLPFLVPMLEHKIYGNYAVFSEGFMAPDSLITSNQIGLKAFILEERRSDDLTFYLNIVAIIFAVIVIIKNKKVKNNKWLLWGSLLMVLLSVLMMSKYFPWTHMPSFLKMIQFPWRLEAILTLGLSILAAYLFVVIKKSNWSKLCLAICLVSCLYIAYDNLNYKETTYYYPTEEVMAYDGLSGKEYLPMNAINHLDYFESRSNEVIVLDGDAEIEILDDSTPDMEFTIETDGSLIELPRLFYFGYHITIEYDDGTRETLSYQEDEYGFIAVGVNASGTIKVTYTGSKKSRLANIIAIVTLILFIIYLFIGDKTRAIIKEKQNRRR